MKNKVFRIFSAVILLITVAMIFSGCVKKENKNSLENTEWKLVSIVDYINNTSKVPEPSKDNNISTFVEESPDGYAFLQYIIKVDKFVLDGNILKLYYNNQIYLEFNRR